MAKSRRAYILLCFLIGILLCIMGVNRYRHRLDDALMDAVVKGNDSEALRLLQRGANPNYSRSSPMPPHSPLYVLPEAIQSKGSLQLIQALFKHGANPNIARYSGESALDRAILAKREDILELLLEKGVRESASAGSSPMHLAASQSSGACYRLLRDYGYFGTIDDAIRVGEVADVQRFLDRGEDVNRTNGYAATLLMQALTFRQKEVVKLLLARGADVNRASRFSTPLRLAQQVRDPKLIALLKAEGAQINLVEAIRMQDLPRVRQCLQEGANVNAQPPGYASGMPNPDYAPLFQAIAVGNPEIVRMLLEAKANVNLRALTGQTPLIWATQRGEADIARALIAKGADLNATDTTLMNAVKAAILYEHEDLYRMLRDKGATVELFDAAAIGDIETIRQCARQGIDINRPNRQGNTPLMLAAIHGQVAALHALLDLGADIEASTPQQETALLKVVWTDHTDSVRLLLDRGANPNAAATGGRTAVMRAAESGRLENLRELLAKGGDPTAFTLQGDTALKLAERRGRSDVSALLRQAGAQE